MEIVQNYVGEYRIGDVLHCGLHVIFHCIIFCVIEDSLLSSPASLYVLHCMLILLYIL